MKQLESSLVVCKEELNVYVEQYQETKTRHELEIADRESKVNPSILYHILTYIGTVNTWASGDFPLAQLVKGPEFKFSVSFCVIQRH